MNKPLKILAIETALDGCGIGVLCDEETTVSYEFMTRGQAEVLIPRIQELLKSKNLQLSNLDAVTVTLGPGSFTGSRVGLAAAQGISYAASIPCFGYSTLEIVSLCEEGKVAIGLDSKRGDVFFQMFDREKQPIQEPTILSYEEVEALSENATLLTNISHLNGNSLKGEKVVEKLLLKAKEDFKAGNIQDNHVSPIYLRDAEVSKSKTKYREIG